MAARRTTTENTPKTRRRPATTPQAREQQVAAAAFDLAEKQILEGTASSQVITHFLKAVSTRDQLEKERMQHEIELMKAKREAMASAERVEQLYEGAINAMRSYAGQPPIDFGGGDEDEVLL